MSETRLKRLTVVVEVFVVLAGAGALGLTPGCSLRRGLSNGGEPEVVQVQAPALEATGTVLNETGISEDILINSSDLDVFEKLSINLAFADVRLTGDYAGRKGTVRVQRIKGDASCKVYLDRNAQSLELSENPPSRSSETAISVSAVKKLLARVSSMPPEARCRYSVEVGLKTAAELSIELKRGAIAIEHWDKPAYVRVDWGDIDVGSVDALDVKCGRCTLAGEGIAGALRFALDSGNVGLSGLSGAVEGQTYGDTILKWRRVKPNAAVKLVSKAGDVILTFPKGVPLDMELKAPRGDVFTPKDKVQRHGIPVSVTAEVGNVRLYSSNTP